ncbi:hypothetical protein NUSPORA_02056 [Nucleospora cyclopteri]
METARINKYMQKNEIKIIIYILSAALNRKCKITDLFTLTRREFEVFCLKLYRTFLAERKKDPSWRKEHFFTKSGEKLSVTCSCILNFIKLTESIYTSPELFELIHESFKISPSFNSATAEMRKFTQFIFNYILKNEFFFIRNFPEETCSLFGEFIERNYKAIFLSLMHVDLKIFRACIIVSMTIFNEYPQFMTDSKRNCESHQIENLLLFLDHFLALDCRKYLNSKRFLTYTNILLGKTVFTREKQKKLILRFFEQLEIEELAKKIKYFEIEVESVYSDFLEKKNFVITNRVVGIKNELVGIGAVFDAMFSCASIRPTRKMGETAALLVKTEYLISVLNVRLLGNSFYKPFQSIYRYSGYYPIMQPAISALADCYIKNEEKFCRPLFRALFWGPRDFAFKIVSEKLSLKLSMRIKQIREIFCSDSGGVWPHITKIYTLVKDDEDRKAFADNIYSLVSPKTTSREQEAFYLRVFEESLGILCGSLADSFYRVLYRRAKANELRDKKLQTKILSRMFAEKIFLFYVESIRNGKALKIDKFSWKISLLIKSLIDDHPVIVKWQCEWQIPLHRRNAVKYFRFLASSNTRDNSYILHFVACFPSLITKMLINELFVVYEKNIFNGYILIMFNMIFSSEVAKDGLEFVDTEKLYFLLFSETRKRTNAISPATEPIQNDLLKNCPLIVLRINLYYKLLSNVHTYIIRMFDSIRPPIRKIHSCLLSEAILYFEHSPQNEFNLIFTDPSWIFEDPEGCAMAFMLNPEGAYNMSVYFHDKHLKSLRKYDTSIVGGKLPNFMSYENRIGYIIDYVVEKVFNKKIKSYEESVFGKYFSKFEEKMEGHEYADAIRRIRKQLVRRPFRYD